MGLVIVGEMRSIANEVIQISIGVIGLLLVLGIAMAGLENQINHLMGKPTTTNYSGKLMLLTLILGIAAISVSISQSVAHALGL